MTRTALDYDENWFDPEEFARLRRLLPMSYVHAVPVRMGDGGEVESIGLILRSSPDGALVRELVGGRVRYCEPLRDALLRHAEKDLGPLALPAVPPALAPFHVAEYFPSESARLHDPRQHAIALCYILPVAGDCEPRRDALSLDWLSPSDAVRGDVLEEMPYGQHHILRAALAHLGLLP